MFPHTALIQQFYNASPMPGDKVYSPQWKLDMGRALDNAAVSLTLITVERVPHSQILLHKGRGSHDNQPVPAALHGKGQSRSNPLKRVGVGHIWRLFKKLLPVTVTSDPNVVELQG